MTISWNGRAFLDRALDEIWSSATNASMLARAVIWANEIQDDIVSLIPADEMKFNLKKLLPVTQEYISLEIEIPSAPTVAAAAGGTLTVGSAYIVYTTFVIYDQDTDKYMESQPSLASSSLTISGTNQTIDLTAIDTMGGSTSYQPTTIYRNVYMSELASGETAHGPALYIGQITNNTATTYSITAEPTGTVSPPSDSEIDQISSDFLFFPANNTHLVREDANRLRRYDPDGSDSASPYSFDYWKLQGIRIYPRLSSTASTNQRTLLYTVHRRPHEIFYDVSRRIDLPIICKPAMIAGILWKGYEFRDRSGKESKQINYEKAKKELEIKFLRARGTRSTITDTEGDHAGNEV